jgi:hypothetical protein
MKNFGWTHKNLLLNGRLAMLGVIAMIGAYIVKGQIIPGIF